MPNWSLQSAFFIVFSIICLFLAPKCVLEAVYSKYHSTRVIKYIQQVKNLCTKQLYLMILWCHMKCFALKNFWEREKKKNTNKLNPDSSKPHNYLQKHKNFQLKCHVSRDNWNSKTKIKSLTAVRNGFKLIKLQVKIVSGKRQNP